MIVKDKCNNDKKKLLLQYFDRLAILYKVGQAFTNNRLINCSPEIYYYGKRKDFIDRFINRNDVKEVMEPFNEFWCGNLTDESFISVGLNKEDPDEFSIEYVVYFPERDKLEFVFWTVNSSGLNALSEKR